jgi:hypothetical protein
MNIEFITEHATTFALSFNEVYQGKVHEELLWCEATPKHGRIEVRWESVWGDPFWFDNMEQAQKFILDNYHCFNPFSNGTSYDIE